MAENTCPLLSLPRELRDSIWHFTTVEPYLMDIRPPFDYTTNECLESRHVPLEPGLLATCRQIRSEACPIFYAQNRFCCAITTSSRHGHLSSWLNQIGSNNAAKIKSLRLASGMDDPWSEIFELKDVKGWELPGDAIIVVARLAAKDMVDEILSAGIRVTAVNILDSEWDLRDRYSGQWTVAMMDRIDKLRERARLYEDKDDLILEAAFTLLDLLSGCSGRRC